VVSGPRSFLSRAQSNSSLADGWSGVSSPRSPWSPRSPFSSRSAVNKEDDSDADARVERSANSDLEMDPDAVETETGELGNGRAATARENGDADLSEAGSEAIGRSSSTSRIGRRRSWKERITRTTSSQSIRSVQSTKSVRSTRSYYEEIADAMWSDDEGDENNRAGSRAGEASAESGEESEPGEHDDGLGRVPYVAIAEYEYEGAGPKDLSFELGEKIQVIGRASKGWWRGRNQSGAVGLFPSTYVRTASEGEAEVPPGTFESGAKRATAESVGNSDSDTPSGLESDCGEDL